MSAACLRVIKKLRVFRVFKVFREKNNQLTRAATLIALTNKITNIMRKNYCQPATEIAGVVMESQLLAGSPAAPAGAPGVNGVRSGYGTEAIEETWG